MTETTTPTATDARSAEQFARARAALPGGVNSPVRAVVFDPLDPSDVAGLGVAMRKVRASLRDT